MALFRLELPNGLFGDPLVVVRLRWLPRVLLFDCGDLTRVPNRTLLETTDVLVSHAHVDHVFGMGRILRTRMHHPERPLRLIGPPRLAEKVSSHLAGYAWNLVDAYPFDLTVVEIHDRLPQVWRFPRTRGFEPLLETNPGDEPDESVLEDELLAIRVRSLDHGGLPSIAYRVEQNIAHHVDASRLDGLDLSPGPWLTELKAALREGAPGDRKIEVESGPPTRAMSVEELRRELIDERPGDVVAYGTDFSADEENVERMCEVGRDARLLVLEAHFAREHRGLAEEHAHLTTTDAGAIARACGARALCPLHLSARYENDRERVWAEIAQAAKPVPVIQLRAAVSGVDIEGSP